MRTLLVGCNPGESPESFRIQYGAEDVMVVAVEIEHKADAFSGNTRRPTELIEPTWKPTRRALVELVGGTSDGRQFWLPVEQVTRLEGPLSEMDRNRYDIELYGEVIWLTPKGPT